MNPKELVEFYHQAMSCKSHKRVKMIDYLIHYIDKQDETYIKDYQKYLEKREREINKKRNINLSWKTDEEKEKERLRHRDYRRRKKLGLVQEKSGRPKQKKEEKNK